MADLQIHLPRPTAAHGHLLLFDHQGAARPLLLLLILKTCVHEVHLLPLPRRSCLCPSSHGSNDPLEVRPVAQHPAARLCPTWQATFQRRARYSGVSEPALERVKGRGEKRTARVSDWRAYRMLD